MFGSVLTTEQNRHLALGELTVKRKFSLAPFSTYQLHPVLLARDKNWDGKKARQVRCTLQMDHCEPLQVTLCSWPKPTCLENFTSSLCSTASQIVAPQTRLPFQVSPFSTLIIMLLVFSVHRHLINVLCWLITTSSS